MIDLARIRAVMEAGDNVDHSDVHDLIGYIEHTRSHDREIQEAVAAQRQGYLDTIERLKSLIAQAEYDPVEKRVCPWCHRDVADPPVDLGPGKRHQNCQAFTDEGEVK